METADVVAVVIVTVVALLAGAFAAALVVLIRTLRALRATVDALRTEVLDLLEDASAAVRDATIEVDRIERLVTSAERIEGAVDSAGKLAYRTLASPVVKAMAFGTGVSRATQRLRAGETPTPLEPERARRADRQDRQDRQDRERRRRRERRRGRRSA